MTHNRLPLVAPASGLPVSVGELPAYPTASFDHRDPEERDLFRLATHIAHYDPGLTEVFVRIAQRKAEQNATQEAG